MIRWRPPAAIGWQGSLALLLLAAAAWLALGLTPHWQAQADALRHAQRRLPRAAPAPAPVVLPDAGDPHERSADLLALAIRHGVAIDRSAQRGEGPPLDRLRVSMTARGTYADLRAFIADALAADPALALERLQLRRPDAGANRIEAELQWLLLMPRGARR